MKLVINDIEFQLYDYCQLEYFEDSDSTHIIFDMDEPKYLLWIEQVFDVLNIERFKHSLGITFGHLSIYWPGKTPPNNVSVIE
jgi:hypothetical protein